jgi:hypothetical protein
MEFKCLIVISPDSIPTNPTRYFDVPIMVLSNGNETQALIIPIKENTNTQNILKPGIYRFDFSIDRVRFRSKNKDNL